MRAQYVRYGFEEVLSPTIYKKSLWQISGHWDKYADDMFKVTGKGATGHTLAESEKETGEDEEYGLKPMNCPGHCLIFKASPKSWRDLPIRYADFSPLHRDEISGALTGLTRVRRFHQDDAHIFCRPSQIQEEISETLKLVQLVYNTIKLPNYDLVLSTRPDNYIGDLESWNKAEDALKKALDASGKTWTVHEGDGAFYGPKIDIIVRDAHNKTHQTATVQLDFQLPERFDLTYIAESSESDEILPREHQGPSLARPVMIHRAVFGSLERFMALVLERFDGKYPFWLSPRQAIVLPVKTDDPEVMAYAKKVQQQLRGAFVSADDEIENTRAVDLNRAFFAVDLDDRSEPFKVKVATAKKGGWNMIVTVGRRDLEAGTVSLDYEDGAFAPVGVESPNEGDASADAKSRKKTRNKKQATMAAGEVYDYFCTLSRSYL
jgi:threonyl-tRNA synthetase